MAEEVEAKKPSKKELKKAAKKAEKAAKKQANPNQSKKSSENEEKKISESKPTKVLPVFELSGFSGKEDDGALKAVMTSLLYDVSMVKSSSSGSEPSFMHGPVLKTYEGVTTVAFGANAVCKAISLYAGKLETASCSLVDNWLEFERLELRTAQGKKMSLVLKVIEEGLVQNKDGGGLYLVNDW